MPSVEIKPGVELDTAVANACGEIPGVSIESDGSPWTDYHGSDVRWRPSVDLNHAFAAAEKCGLFIGNDLTKAPSGWRVRYLMFEGAESELVAESATPALAICAAIIEELKSRGGNS